MTEAEWLASEDPRAMLSWAEGEDLRGHRPYPISDRKLRLFACACFLTHNRTEGEASAVALAERIADGEAPVVPAVLAIWNVLADSGLEAASYQITDAGMGDAKRKRRASAVLLRDVVGNPFLPSRLYRTSTGLHPIRQGSIMTQEDYLYPTVIGVAREAYDIRRDDNALDPDRLAVLSDALEDAGCEDADLLCHLRSPGPHVRGCWALDLILGKE